MVASMIFFGGFYEKPMRRKKIKSRLKRKRKMKKLTSGPLRGGHPELNQSEKIQVLENIIDKGKYLKNTELFIIRIHENSYSQIYHRYTRCKKWYLGEKQGERKCNRWRNSAQRKKRGSSDTRKEEWSDSFPKWKKNIYLFVLKSFPNLLIVTYGNRLLVNILKPVPLLDIKFSVEWDKSFRWFYLQFSIISKSQNWRKIYSHFYFPILNKLKWFEWN